MNKKMLILMSLLLFVTGCFATLPTATVEGAKVLKKGMDMAEKDYQKVGSALMDLVENPTEENLEKLTVEKAAFDKVFKAIRFAVDSTCDGIIELGED